MNDINKLNEFGMSFQEKVISCWMTDPSFLRLTVSEIDPEHFEGENLQWISEFVKTYQLQYHQPPTLETFKFQLEKEFNTTNVSIKDSIIQKLQSITKFVSQTNDHQYVKDNYIEFIQNQAIKRAILDSADLLKFGKYEEIKQKIVDATLVGKNNDIGTVWNTEESFLLRNKEESRNTIETPWEVINDIMDGGLAAGELGIVVAPAGIGKSWLLVAIGTAAARAGLNVIHYTLELDENYVSRRYDACISQFAVQELKYHAEDVWKYVSRVKGNLVVKWYPTKRASVSDLEAHISLTTAFGFKPDLVIVDYADLLRGNASYANHQKRFELENIYEDLRGMLGKFQIPGWSASQANRSALEEDVIEADKVSEAYSKIMIADFIMSLSRKIQDKVANTGRTHIIKNRFGPDGMTFPMRVNTSNGDIQLYQSDTTKGKEATDDSKNFHKELLSQHKKEFDKRRSNGMG